MMTAFVHAPRGRSCPRAAMRTQEDLGLAVGRLWMRVAAAALIGLCGCRELSRPAAGPAAGRPIAGQRMFASDDEAAKALIRSATDANTN